MLFAVAHLLAFVVVRRAKGLVKANQILLVIAQRFICDCTPKTVHQTLEKGALVVEVTTQRG